jgi:hypothetical protein
MDNDTAACNPTVEMNDDDQEQLGPVCSCWPRINRRERVQAGARQRRRGHKLVRENDRPFAGLAGPAALRTLSYD